MPSREEPRRAEPVKLAGRTIPRDERDNPTFTSLKDVQASFSDDEIVRLVNRAIYQMEYQRTVHRDRFAEEQARLAPIKKKVKELFHISWAKATPQQLEVAMKAVAEDAIIELVIRGETPKV